MVQYLGSPPANLIHRCAARDKYFDELGEYFILVEISALSFVGNFTQGEPQSVALEERVDMEPEHAPFFDCLRHMLRWDPEQRATASELLKHSWLQFE